jgi:hypothetical protein
MPTSDLQLSGLSSSTRTDDTTNPDTPVAIIRPVRSWTLRMAQALALPRRRIQKLLIEGAPDATDDFAGTDWQTLERSWRQWIGNHPRYRSLTRRMRSSTDLDSGAQNAGSAAAGADLPPAGMIDPIKQRRCQLLDLQIGAESGRLVPRDAAKDLLAQTLQMALGRIDEIPALLAQQIPIDQRDQVRQVGKRIAATERYRFESDIRRLWKDRMPALRPTFPVSGV